MKLAIGMTAALLAVTWPCIAAEDTGKKVDFDVYNGYFESNRSGLKGEASYLAFTDMDSFRRVFGIGRVLGNRQRFLPRDAFDTRTVVAVIKRGNRIWSYEVRGVTARGQTLTVSYHETSQDGGSARFASPLIPSVPKGKYSKVVFIANGKKAGTATIEDRPTTSRAADRVFVALKPEPLPSGP